MLYILQLNLFTGYYDAPAIQRINRVDILQKNNNIILEVRKILKQFLTRHSLVSGHLKTVKQDPDFYARMFY